MARVMGIASAWGEVTRLVLPLALLLVCVLLVIPSGECLSESDPIDVLKNGGVPHEQKNEVETISKDSNTVEQVASDNGSPTNTLQFGFVHAFVASLSVIIVSEIGDKTFFIAAILAMKHSRLLVFLGAISALGLMTFLSVCLGFATTVIPRWVTFYICTLLLAVFGVKMLYEAWHMKPDEGQEEFEEVSAELKKREENVNIHTNTNHYQKTQ
jgi:predicted tellurium resistance membrane protein TerC